MSIPVSPTRGSTDLSQAAQRREAYLAELLALAQRSQPSLPWLKELRDRAVARVQEQTFPTTRQEEWRFTDLSPLLDVPLTGVEFVPSITAAEIAPFVLPEAASRLVFVDSQYAPSLSVIAGLPASAIVGNLATLDNSQPLQAYFGQQPGAEDLFTALNTAGLTDAAIVFIPKNAVVDAPIHLLFIATADDQSTLIQPRILVVAEPNSAVTLIEEYVTLGAGQSLTNSVTEIWLGENAQVNHTRIQRESQTAFHIGRTAVSQARTTRYTSNVVNIGAAITRHNLDIYQTGEQTETRLNGLTIIHGEQLSDTHSTIALSKPYGMTRQLQKCIVDDKAHAVFNGKVSVPQAAQLTDAGQLNRNLLLSSKARIDTKPQLEIVADNVKCTHGAAVGQLDVDEIFYLESRGIDAADARRLLIYGFAFEILAQIPIDSLRQTLSQWVSSHAK